MLAGGRIFSGGSYCSPLQELELKLLPTPLVEDEYPSYCKQSIVVWWENREKLTPAGETVRL